MGFYGNITDTSNTFFQFDKIFSSRKKMDEACANKKDGIYTGRFVLVKYDIEEALDRKLTFYDFLLFGYKSEEQNILYIDHSCQKPYLYTTYSIVQNPSENNWNLYYKLSDDEKFYIKLQSKAQFNNEDIYYTADNYNENIKDRLVGLNTICYQKDITTTMPGGAFYQCTGGNEDNVALWTRIGDYNQYGEYLSNFHEDCQHYGNLFDARGYDGTVWQKIYHAGVGQFIQVARLNGSIPAIEIYGDIPSTLPAEAYIDSASQADLYRIKVPGTWGFRIKEAQEEEPSEQNITQQYYRYNNNELESYEKDIRADIYFNLNPSIEVPISEDSEETNTILLQHSDYELEDVVTSNEIIIEPTGKSGKRYYAENNELEEQFDTYELSVHLPVIGNMISKGYDIIYGQGEIEDETIHKKKRPRDIFWYDGTASQSLKDNGDPSFGGKSNELNTFAGTLNTMHNRLGQIICKMNSIPTSEQIKFLSSNYLYEIDGFLYRVGTRYKKITIGDYIYIIDRQAGNNFDNPNITYYTFEGYNGAGEPQYQEAFEYNEEKTYYYKKPWCKYDPDPDAQFNFSTNKYYENKGTQEAPNYQPSTDVEYNSSKTYYLKNINPARFSEITLTNYQPGNYYYLDGENYYCDWNSPSPAFLNRDYYTITTPPRKTFEVGYVPNRYYRLDQSTGAYKIERSSIPDPLDNRPFYDLKNITHTPTDEPCIIYQPGYFYYEDKNNLGQYEICNLTISQLRDPAVFQTYNFYVFTFSNVPQYGKNENGDIIEYYEAINATNITNKMLIPDEGVTYYYKDDINNPTIFIPYENLNLIMDNPYDTPRYYYILPTLQPYSVESMYLPNRYYEYDLESQHYTKATGSFNKEAYYCELSNQYIHLVPDPFYIQNIYYHRPNPISYPDDYQLAADEYMDSTKAPFYNKTSFYVEKDEAHECPYGYEWNDFIPYVPPSVSLYAREEYQTLVPINSEPTNSEQMPNLNSALLHLHQQYDPLNNEIRDTTTFRGLLNSAKDLLYQVKKLKPGHICYVNDFGQITSSDITYKQLKNLIQ